MGMVKINAKNRKKIPKTVYAGSFTISASSMDEVTPEGFIQEETDISAITCESWLSVLYSINEGQIQVLGAIHTLVCYISWNHGWFRPDRRGLRGEGLFMPAEKALRRSSALETILFRPMISTAEKDPYGRYRVEIGTFECCYPLLIFFTGFL